MGITFESHDPKACCLCGSTSELTGEHKIKASTLRTEFGTERMMIGQFGEPIEKMRIAQGVKSKTLHFNARMCALCNNSRTQAADHEFDKFHQIARALLDQGKDPKMAFDDKRYSVVSGEYLNLFRYFSKLLCCHMAEIGSPRPLHMSRFAIGLTNENCVWLDVGEDWTYKTMSDRFGELQYAAHGGLAIYADKKTGSPDAFHSTLTIGSLRYVFHSRLNWLERLELKLLHREFYDWCSNRVFETIDQPLSEEDKLKLGLATEDPHKR